MTSRQRNKDSVAKQVYADREDPFGYSVMAIPMLVRVQPESLRRDSCPGSEGRNAVATGCAVNIPRSFPLRVVGTYSGKFREVGKYSYGYQGKFDTGAGYGVPTHTRLVAGKTT